MLYLLIANIILTTLIYFKVVYIVRYFKNAEQLMIKQIEDNRKIPMYTYRTGSGYEH